MAAAHPAAAFPHWVEVQHTLMECVDIGTILPRARLLAGLMAAVTG